MGDLTEHFSRHEFRCRCAEKGFMFCGGSASVDLGLVGSLEELRRKIGVPLTINSGFRCLSYNRGINSDDNSQHVIGLAADVACPPGWTPQQLANLAETIYAFNFGGIGIYPDDNFVHLDVRTGPTRWAG